MSDDELARQAKKVHELAEQAQKDGDEAKAARLRVVHALAIEALENPANDG